MNQSACHYFLPKFGKVAEAELPGLTEALVAAGGWRCNPIDGISLTEMSGGGREGDERFDTVTARRPVTESIPLPWSWLTETSQAGRRSRNR